VRVAESRAREQGRAEQQSSRPPSENNVSCPSTAKLAAMTESTPVVPSCWGKWQAQKKPPASPCWKVERAVVG